MYYILAVLTGAIASTNIVITGALGKQYSSLQLTLYIYVLGTLVFLCCLWLSRTKFQWYKGYPAYFYTGGLCGVLSSCFSMLAYQQGLGATGVSSIFLLSGTLLSLCIDTFGLFGMKKRRFPKKKLVGLGLIMLGTFTILLF